jgi:valyl-tRNA synthetase
MIHGFDILFFWCARMIMLGLEFMGDVPFRQVYIHGLVRDAEKQKMSKTRGNVIDPLVVTEKYGTDAVRMALLQGAAPGTDIVLTEERMSSSRDFGNKIWNAARFLFMNMERSGVEPWVPESLEKFTPEADAETGLVPIEDRWIFSRLNAAAESINNAIGQYRYHEAAQTLWHFFWHEFCDWYVELKKPRFRENSGLDAHWRNMLAAFETALRLLHPVMPFITEELWQRIATGQPNRAISVAQAAYPRPRADWADAEAEAEIDALQEIVTLARTLRAENQIDPRQELDGTLHADAGALEMAARHEAAIRTLARVRLQFHEGSRTGAAGAARSTARYDLALALPQAQIEAQRKRLEKDRDQFARNITNSKRQLSDEVFLSKAPPAVVEGLRRKLSDYEAQLAKIESALAEGGRG